MDILEIAQQIQQDAWKVVEETQVITLWESIGAEVNLVGSLKTGLMMKNRDIDFHIYTNELVLEDSFRAMEKLAENSGIKEICYKNLIHTEEHCIEWHAWYEDIHRNRWQLDLIHLLKGSRYDGVVEKATEAISQVLTPELRRTILQIKFDTPDDLKISGIEIYYAVISSGVRNYEEFLEWREANFSINYLEWLL